MFPFLNSHFPCLGAWNICENFIYFFLCARRNKFLFSGRRMNGWMDGSEFLECAAWRGQASLFAKQFALRCAKRVVYSIRFHSKYLCVCMVAGPEFLVFASSSSFFCGLRHDVRSIIKSFGVACVQSSISIALVLSTLDANEFSAVAGDGRCRKESVAMEEEKSKCGWRWWRWRRTEGRPPTTKTCILSRFSNKFENIAKIISKAVSHRQRRWLRTSTLRKAQICCLLSAHPIHPHWIRFDGSMRSCL